MPASGCCEAAKRLTFYRCLFVAEEIAKGRGSLVGLISFRARIHIEHMKY